MNRRILNKESRISKGKRKFDLEDRLIRFALSVIDIVELLPNSVTARHFANQLSRCATAPALNYAEAQAAESRKDFIHKMKISLKELRETYVILKIIKLKPFVDDKELLNKVINENDELISIFVKSISTAQSNLKKR